MRKNGKEVVTAPPFGVGGGWAPYFERPEAKKPKRAKRRASPAKAAGGAPKPAPRFSFWCPGCDRPVYEAACEGCGCAPPVWFC